MFNRVPWKAFLYSLQYSNTFYFLFGFFNCIFLLYPVLLCYTRFIYSECLTHFLAVSCSWYKMHASLAGPGLPTVADDFVKQAFARSGRDRGLHVGLGGSPTAFYGRWLRREQRFR